MNIKKLLPLLLICVLIVSCNKKNENEPQKEERQNEVISVEDKNDLQETSEILPENEGPIDCISVFQETFKKDKPIIKRFLLANDVTLYIMDKNYNPTPIGTVEGGTRISIIAHLQEAHRIEDKDFYLISLNQGNIWDGWIEASNINFDIPEYPDFFLYSLFINISPSNKYMAYCSGWNESIYVINSDASTIINIPFSEIQEVDGGFIDWSTDEKQVWYYTNEDAITTSYVIINIEEQSYRNIRALPNDYYVLNVDNGDYLCTDYPFQFDSFTAEKTKKSGKEFHLYYGNLFSNDEPQIIRNSYGINIKIKKDNNQLFYEDENGIMVAIE